MINKGFTLIELLVVIAILGILASAVLVAINPSERINEAYDSGEKSDVSQVAIALESYFTNNKGSYFVNGTPITKNNLTNDGYLKQFPNTVEIDVSSDGKIAIAYAAIIAISNQCNTGTGGTKYWVYYSPTGVSQVECLDSPPNLP